MGSAFSTKTIYRFIASLESVFAVVTLSFGIKCLVIYDETAPTASDTDFVKKEEDEYGIYGHREYIQFSAIAAVTQSVIQIIIAILLATKSKFSDKPNEDIHPGPAPKIWIYVCIILFILQMLVFFVPTLLYENTVKEKDEMKSTLKELFTYTIVSAVFKGFFIWGVVSKLHNSGGNSQTSPLFDDEKSLDKE